MILRSWGVPTKTIPCFRSELNPPTPLMYQGNFQVSPQKMVPPFPIRLPINFPAIYDGKLPKKGGTIPRITWLVGGFNSFGKIFVKMGSSSPNFGVNIKKCLSCHHPAGNSLEKQKKPAKQKRSLRGSGYLVSG